MSGDLGNSQGMLSRSSIELRSYLPRPSDVSDDEQRDFFVTWENILYRVYRSWFDRTLSNTFGLNKSLPDSKTILKGVSGSFRCGEMTALMGPSGAGKSTLLECLIGRRGTGLTGTISVKEFTKIKIAFIPQHDHFFGQLTVRENIIFASKLQHATMMQNNSQQQQQEQQTPSAESDPITANSSTITLNRQINFNDAHYHETVAADIMDKLGLTVCADNKIASCSGGQQKRLAIAAELVSKPNILVLDEPTSGLDSASCNLVCELLRRIATGTPRVAVIMTIHQPSFRVFMLFHKIYMLSNQTGKCVYDGPPEDVVNQLDRVRLKCPEYYNPADFLVEIASGDKGIPVLKQLSKEQEHCFKEQAKQWTNVSSQSLLTIVAKQPRFPIFKHSWLLYQRSMTISFRDLWLFGLRLTMHVFNALFMGLLFGDAGDEDGCPVQLKTNFDIDELEDIQASVVRRDKDLYYNSGCIFFTVMFLMFAGMMPSVLTFPSELNILIKERFNQWYSVTVYYLAKTLADIPFTVAFPVLYGLIHYFINAEGDEFWRLVSYTGVLVLTANVASSQGMLISAVLVDSPSAAVFLAPLSLMPMMLLCGFFIRIDDLGGFLEVCSYVAYARFALEGSMVIIYGHDRCKNITNIYESGAAIISNWTYSVFNISNIPSPSENATYSITNITSNTTLENEQSHTINSLKKGLIKQFFAPYFNEKGEVNGRLLIKYDLDDDDIYKAIGILFATLVILRIVTFIVVYRKAYAKR